MTTPVFWIEGPWKGRLAVSSRPRGGDWLEDEISGWAREGVGEIVSMLTDEEIAELALTDEARAARAQGLSFRSFPVPDRGAPSHTKAVVDQLNEISEALHRGKAVLVHCRQGVGRSGLVAACLLGLSGMNAQQAMDRVSAARRVKAPETDEQRRWVDDFLAGRTSPGPA